MYRHFDTTIVVEPVDSPFLDYLGAFLRAKRTSCSLLVNFSSNFKSESVVKKTVW